MSYPCYKAIQFLSPKAIFSAAPSQGIGRELFVVSHKKEPDGLLHSGSQNELTIGFKSNFTLGDGPIRGKLIDPTVENFESQLQGEDLLFVTCESAEEMSRVMNAAIVGKIFEGNPDVKLVFYGAEFLPQVLPKFVEELPNIDEVIRKHVFCAYNCSDEDYVKYLLSKLGEDNLLLEYSTKIDVSTILPHIPALVRQKIFVRNAADLLQLKIDPLFKKWNYDRDSVTVIDSPAIQLLSSKIRQKDADCFNFVRYGDRLMTLLAEETLARLPSVSLKTLTSPTGTFTGLDDTGNQELCVISIIRSGDILLEAFKRLLPSVRIGKILIQRDESTPDKRPVFFYRKLPPTISNCFCLIVDPMLGTGGSVTCAIKCLLDSGVPTTNIIFVNVYAAEEGLERLHRYFPEVRTVTLSIDEYLNHDKYLVPGVGDFGDRYYGTVSH